MDPKESEFFEKLMATFREEASEHVKELSSGLLQIEQNKSPALQEQLIEKVFREAHSLKGAARSVNQHKILEICQAMESIFALWKQNKNFMTAEAFDQLYAAINAIDKLLSGSLDPNLFHQILERLDVLKNNGSLISEDKAPIIEDKGQSALPPKNSEPEVIEQKSHEKTIRIALDKMNRFFQDAEETLTIKMLFADQLNHLKQLQMNLYSQEKHLEHLLLEFQILRQSFLESSSSTKELEGGKNVFKLIEKQILLAKSNSKELSKLVKKADLSSHLVSSYVDILLEDLKKILMQPISILFEVLPRMVRDIAKDLSKEIHLEFEGEDIEVDRRILEDIKDPVIHIIRNAIDHGIETPDQRKMLNKPPYGTIRIVAVENEAKNLKLSISDDGRGMDVAKIKQVAKEKGMLSQQELETLSDEEAIKLAFHVGVSTSPIVTELSGRGVGLNVVAEKVDQLGGQLNVESKLHEGTTFSMTLPLTLATFRGVRILVVDQEFILPSHNVERVIRIQAKDIKRIENLETLVYGNRTFSFVHLADLLKIHRTATQQNEYIFALMIRSAEQTIMFGADYVYGEQEILVKSLGKQMVKVKNTMAATISESGQVIPILNPADLIKNSTLEKTAISEKLSRGLPLKKSILLVEDSMTTRLLFRNILTSANYEVKTAVDGVEALEILKDRNFDLMVIDIEMPRMDGFTLLETIRNQSQRKELPVIICTSRGSSSDREKGIKLGANAYIDKKNFNVQLFLDVIKKLI